MRREIRAHVPKSKGNVVNMSQKDEIEQSVQLENSGKNNDPRQET